MSNSESDRPDPDALLARVQRDQERAARGRLRIYFGASAGVGKTFAMLAAARQVKREGRDVVVGVVETHGRSETAALLDGLEVLPLRQIEYKGRKLGEFDLDAALARHPALLLVDELAHSNVQGSRHPKRWQDVDELLAAGIDVLSSLNVQHLESLNDVVAGITGVRVNETVPDTFFDSAHEVMLVDLPAEELLERLASGKVYIPEQARHAAKNFFRRGNLMALRELALRRTAERVDEDVQVYRSDESIRPVWKTEASLLCCVGPHPGCENVVRATARFARQSNTAWHAAYVETPSLQRLPENERERILRIMRLAQELGARTTILADDNVAARLIEYARVHNLSRMVMGRPVRQKWWPWSRSLARQVAARAPDIDVVSLGHVSQGTSAESARPASQAERGTIDNAKLSQRHGHYLWAVLACLVTTLLAMPLAPYLHLTNLAMLYLLTVAWVAMRGGRAPAVLSAFLNVAAYDFFFVPPRFSFAVSDFQYILTFAVMLTVGLIIGELTARSRYQARFASHREERTRALYEFARDLSSVLRNEDVTSLTDVVIGQAFRAEVHVLIAAANRQLDIPIEVARLPDFEPAIAVWAFDHGQSAGAATDTLPGSQWLYLPLLAPSRTRGVLALKAKSRRILMVPEQRRQLETFAALVAIALERVHYVEVAQQAQIGMASERLRNSLLAALSHDLRTPLAGLVGLADTLTLTQPGLTPQQNELAEGIRDEAHRMSALVSNLLDMARIESGDISLNLQWQPIEEVIGSSLRAARQVLAGHQVDVVIAPDLPLVRFDAALIERVLVNLLENASKYTPPGSHVLIAVERAAPVMIVTVDDDGPGLPAGQEEALFAKFARGEKESAKPGVGLGLSICRAIVEAHGGNILGGTSRLGGARFEFTLPLGDPPEISAEPGEVVERV